MKESRGPTYQLFGEKVLWPGAELVHHETIAARSSRDQWEITPHSHDNLLQVLFVQAGHARMTLETQTEPLPAPCIVMMPPRRLHGFAFSPDVVGHILTLPRFLLGESLALSPALRDDPKVVRCHALAGDAEGLDPLSHLLAQLAREHAGAAPGRATVMKGVRAQILA